jgi:CRP/FNR family cyclic AMP-dependent transcriptional regulator
MHPDLLPTLAAVPLFANIPQPELVKLAALARQENYPKHAEIMAEGDRSSGLYILLSGKVKVVLRSEEGKEIILAILNPTEFFGEMALLDDAPRSADIVAMAPTTVLVIAKQEFKSWLQRQPDMAFVIIKTLAQRLREADQKIGDLALMDVYGRVARALKGLAKPDSQGRMVVNENLSQQSLADIVGASREMVSRTLKDLSQVGHIWFDGKAIVINERAERI